MIMFLLSLFLIDDLPVATVPIGVDNSNLLESASSYGGPSLEESYSFSSSPAVPPDNCKFMLSPPTWQTHISSRDTDILDEVCDKFSYYLHLSKDVIRTLPILRMSFTLYIPLNNIICC